MPKVSVIIPSRNEPYLGNTVLEVLGKTRGDVEVYVVLDGYWGGLTDEQRAKYPNAVLLPHEDKRVHVLHRGRAQGMRPAINAAAELAKGDFLLKIDAHCMLAEGYDVELAASCGPDEVMVPRRHRLNAEAWAIDDGGKPPIDYHYLSYPLARTDPYLGLHGSPWPERAAARAGVLVDDELSSQGSCWFMSRTQWRRVGPLDVDAYGNFIQEFQEIGLKTWLGGGAVRVNKRTWYAHLHKGPKHGRFYWISRQEMDAGADFAMRYWMLDRWAERVRDLRWLIERFAPVPTWPADLDEAFARARRALA